MPIDVTPWLSEPGTLPARTGSDLARKMKGSEILAIAGEVVAVRARGATVANYTIGDFAPAEFRVPPYFLEQLQHFENAGENYYPPAIGTDELRNAVRGYYRRKLGLHYPEGSVLVGSGARPLIYAAFACLLSPGDTVVYQVPSWNTEYYVDLNDARGVPLVATADNDFMLTADDLVPHIREARIVLINSPQNPSGTAISRAAMERICEAILQENRRREQTGERPLFMVYDMVYWQLTVDGVDHVTPVGVAPEMARYTVLVDAISKSWAATGVRVGWAVAPPWLREPMKALIGHMGAWAARATQQATAATLANEDRMEAWLSEYRSKVAGRQVRLYTALLGLAEAGLPVEPVQPQGALYVTARFDLVGQRVGGIDIDSDESLRKALLYGAGVAIVPFVTFGYPDRSGWVRFSIGAVTDDEIDRSVERLRSLLAAREPA